MAKSANGTNGHNGHNGHGGQNIQDVLKTLNGINSSSFANDGDRIQAVVAAYSLVSKLETPWEFVLRTCMGQVFDFAFFFFFCLKQRLKAFLSQHWELL